VTGSPGDGSSALLDDAARSAAAAGGRWLVLAARAAPDESDLDNALVQQVVLPLLDEVDVLGVAVDPAPRAALEVAVGRRAPLPGLVLLPMALLLVLEAVGRRRPVLLVVDDTQWADPPSTAVLRFLGRRLSRTAVCLVAAAPGVPPSAGAVEADVVVPLTPLGREAATAVVDERAPDLDPAEREQLVELAQGRPRRLADLLDLVSGAGGAGSLAEGLRGAQGPSLRRARAQLAEAAPAEQQRLLLLGLLGDPAGRPHLEAALEHLAPPPEGSALRGRPGLPVQRGDTPGTGADPLLAALAVAEAAPDQVARARAAWFEVLCRASGPDTPSSAADEVSLRLGAEARRQSAHLTRGADGALAVGLRRSARSLRRFDGRRAGDLFALAAALDDDPASRAATLLLAAEQALVCGRAAVADDLRERARGAPHHAALGAFERLRALEALDREDTAAATGHLEGALEHLARAASTSTRSSTTAELAEEAVATAAALVVVGGRRTAPSPSLAGAAELLPAEAAARVRSVARLTSPWSDCAPAEQQEALTDLVEVLAGTSLPVLRSAVALARVLGGLAPVADVVRQRAAALTATGPGAVDLHLAGCAADIETSVVDSAEHLRRARAALRHAPGRAEAVDQAQDLLDLVQDGAVVTGAHGGHHRGAEDATDVAAGDLVATTELSSALWSTAYRHRSRGEMGEAAAALSRLWPDPPAVPGPAALSHALPLVHALVETQGDGPALRRVTEEVAAWARGSGAPVAVVTDLLCRGMRAQAPAERLALVEEAARTQAGPVVAGPAQLALGMLLRRARRGVSAREPLERAATAYEAIGLRAFANLARRELAATAPQRPPRRVGSSVLTSQERVVAELAASGASNAEIALSLGISSRTVAHHLQHVYAKLGVTGRRELAGRLPRAAASAARRRAGRSGGPAPRPRGWCAPRTCAVRRRGAARPCRGRGPAPPRSRVRAHPPPPARGPAAPGA